MTVRCHIEINNITLSDKLSGFPEDIFLDVEVYANWLGVRKMKKNITS